MTKRRYFTRVQDRTGKLHSGHWFRVTDTHGSVRYRSMRAWSLIDLAKAKRSNKNLNGFVDSELVEDKIRIDDWLTGNVVPIRKVPKKIRPAYRDTLERAARAARAYGHPVHVNSSFRTAAEQQVMIDRYHAGGPIAAAQGKSPHQRGIGLDIPNLRTTPKLRAAFAAEQLIDDVPSEVWHVTSHYGLSQGW